jgi:hypothetical protein
MASVEGSITLNELTIAEVNEDPSITGADLPVGSFALLSDNINGKVWVKIGVNPTDWVELLKNVDDKTSILTFKNLADVSTTYTGKARFIPTVNDSETGINLVERKALFTTQELITNPSFEDWASGAMPPNWTYSGTGSASTNIEKNTQVTFNGGISLKIKALTGTYSNRRIVSSVYQVPATGNLLSSVYAYLPDTSTPPSSVFFRMNVSFFDSFMNPISTTTNIGQSFSSLNTWITFTRTNVIPTNAVYAQTLIEAQRGGSLATDIILDFASTVVSNISIPNVISDLNDIQIVNPLNNQILSYDSVGSVWRNQTQTHEISEINDLQNSLDSKVNLSEKGIANGVVPLNGSSKIDATYLPSYVDDILEFTNLANFPEIGETGKIYVTTDTNNIYRWSGSAYVELTDDTAIWGNISGNVNNQSDLQNALNLKENAINSATFNRFLATADNTAQLAFQKINSNAVSRLGASDLSGQFKWSKPVAGQPSVDTTIVDGDIIRASRVSAPVPGGPPPTTRVIDITPLGINFLTDTAGVVQPAQPLFPETLVPKKYVDDLAATKENSINSTSFNSFLSSSDNTAQLAFQKINDLAISRNGEFDLVSEFVWKFYVANLYTNSVSVAGNRVLLTREFDPGQGVTRTLEIAPDGIRFLNGSSPATPQFPETLVPKKYVDDLADTKQNTNKINQSGGYAGLDNNAQIFPAALPFKILGGPGQLVQFSGTFFTNSGYVPGIQANSTPSNFGFFPVQNASFVFNPFAILGANKNYRIYAIKRQDGAFNDGLHCMIRKVENESESGIPGLLDWGSGVNTNSAQLSSVLNSGNSNSFMWFKCYFAAYNGGNGATIQDVTLWIVTE